MSEARGPEEVELARRIVRAGVEADMETLRQLLAPRCFIRTRQGRIYAGPDGFRKYREEQFDTTSIREVFEPEFRQLAPGMVMLSTRLRIETPSGEVEDLTGAWMMHFRDGRMVALIHYPTTEKALSGLPGGTIDPTPVELARQVIEIFDRGDAVALVGLLAEDLRFTLVPGKESTVGIAPAVRALASIRRRFTTFHIDPQEISASTDGYVVVDAVIHTVAPQLNRRERRGFLGKVAGGFLAEWHTFPTAAAAEDEVQRRQDAE